MSANPFGRDAKRLVRVGWKFILMAVALNYLPSVGISATLTIADGAGNSTNIAETMPGYIEADCSIGGWTIFRLTALSKPAIGSSIHPKSDVNAQIIFDPSISSKPGGNQLTVTLTEDSVGPIEAPTVATFEGSAGMIHGTMGVIWNSFTNGNLLITVDDTWTGGFGFNNKTTLPGFTGSLAMKIVCVASNQTFFSYDELLMLSNAPGTVANLQVHQQAGAPVVDISYDLIGDASGYSASVLISTNGGLSFGASATHFIGDGIQGLAEPGTGRHIIWNTGADLGYGSFSNVVVQLSAQGPATNSSSFTVDLPGPSGGMLGLGSAQSLATNGFALTFQGIVGSNYLIQGSTDLTNWVPVTNFLSTNSTMYLLDAEATNFTTRFYRAVAQ